MNPSRLRSVKRLIPRSIKRQARRLLEASEPRQQAGLTRGERCEVSPSVSIRGEVKLGDAVNVNDDVFLWDCSIGTYSYLGGRCAVIKSTIGKFSSIAAEVNIGLGRHSLSPFVSTHPAFVLSRPGGWTFADKDYLNEYEPTTIGNDVWLGLRAAIKDGITVSDGAIVAAGAVVIEDVPPYAIVAGVPARIIRYRFSPDVVRFLLDFGWWDRSENWIRTNWSKFHNVEAFMRAFEKLATSPEVVDRP